MKNNKHHMLVLTAIIVMGSLLYFIINIGVKPQLATRQQNNQVVSVDQNGKNIKKIEQMQQDFNKQSLIQQDQSLVKVKQISVPTAEEKQKQKVVAAMETMLDKNIISQISNLQISPNLMEKSAQLSQKIQSLKSLSATDRGQFQQEINAVKQSAQINQ